MLCAFGKLILPAVIATWAAALAQARTAQAQTAALSCREDAMVVLDASGSMAQPAGISTRIDVARGAIRRIIPAAARQRKLGLMTFGPGASDQCSNITTRVPVQPNAGASILAQIDGITPDGGTPLASAIERAADELDSRHRHAVVVVITDGEETCRADPCGAAAALRATSKDLTVHVIGIDAGQSAAMSCFAEMTGGLYIPARTEEELSAALSQTLECPQLALNRK